MIKSAAWRMSEILLRHKKVLFATTRIELSKKYSGSVLGPIWIVLYPILFLCIYLFVYLVVFRMKFPGFSELDYVVYVFSGLVPYISFMEALNTGVTSIRENAHLIKNVILPVELVPARPVLISLVPLMVGLIVLLLLALLNNKISFDILFLPIAVFIQVLFMFGLVWIVSAVGVVLPDAGHFMNLSLLLLLFISPIGFKPEMVPDQYLVLLKFNPIHYMMAPYRMSLLGMNEGDWLTLGISLGGSICIYLLGCSFFRKFKNGIVDYE